MKKLLLSTTAILALAIHMQVACAADLDPVGNADLPTTFISIEGGTLFDASASNVSFDGTDEKLGHLDPLKPGDWGWQGRFELGQQLDSAWDYKLSAAAMSLNDDQSSHGKATASQNTSLQIIDAEVGYRPDDVGLLQTRVFAGVRGLHSTAESNWAYNEDQKLGQFNDEVYAIGPRIGVDLALPIESTGVSLVGSGSASLLLGNAQSNYDYHAILERQTRRNGSDTIWNVEAMAGVSFALGENADFTLGYRAAQFGGLLSNHSAINSDGTFNDDGHSDLLVSGPFARLTVEIQ